MELSLAEIASLVQGELEGDGSIIIRGVAKIETASPGEITFLSNPKYAKYVETTQAAAILVSHDFPATDRPVIRTKNPYFAFLKVLQVFHPPLVTVAEGVHPTAIVDATAQLGKNVRIGPRVVIDRDCKIGDEVVIHPGVVLGPEVEIGHHTLIYANVTVRERVKIGSNVIIHSGTVIGSDGFGFAREGQQYFKIPQVGTVIIEDDVEIGANCAIDRATLGATVIHRGAKLDNLIQVAHNVEIGENTVIAAQTGISGSTKIGKNVMIGGQVGFVGHIEIGDNTVIGAQSGVSKSLPQNSTYFGYPARPMMQAKREEAALRRLPDLLKRVSELEARLESLLNK
ncbi:MAG: UDP-3-O-(3-hydroxymyristoyl)glucosamine N-acyltransferase [candidate division KSB1 bacterium]|nr:UDP-3-O-(3-hydroxymyristoyl)glucosamine N-acyltransferase [candidate division KSB1 bacterium]MDZ7334453.1 UDP-3-O-(3-hydroxymyristoyl)glucosamine N-acyltransferase [candidate division KSB1 bacterium]MDZ7355980.1 UDP-3-O-(3-hydroxymyristoyl)glucosamine N-acyltransferase [candidate division KSB1 bacterium]MDZ7400686.1 UDP-3-O-(3-hydroxymyristoyl)glucosamine N-acyltransferase [candidate division KSB1 bacterium]